VPVSRNANAHCRQELASIEIGTSRRDVALIEKWSIALSKTGPPCQSSQELISRLARSAPTADQRGSKKLTVSSLLDQVWNYPLFEALYGRRFGLGFEMPEGPFRHKSTHAPVPLTELEEALLVGAGTGFTGLAFWDLPTPAPYPPLSARTFPTTRAGQQRCLLRTWPDHRPVGS